MGFDLNFLQAQPQYKDILIDLKKLLTYVKTEGKNLLEEYGMEEYTDGLIGRIENSINCPQKYKFDIDSFEIEKD